MTNQLKRIVFACALACALTMAVQKTCAQPQSGQWEFTLGGGGDADNEFDHGGFSLIGSVGYFFTPNFEAGVRQSVAFSGRGPMDDWSGSSRLAVDYHFLLGKFVPFVGANFGTDFTSDDNVWGLGPELGIKYYVYERTFVFALGEYRWLFDRLSEVTGHADDGRFAFTVGIGFNLGGSGNPSAR